MRISHNTLPQGISRQAAMHQLGKVRGVYEPRHTHPLAMISTLLGNMIVALIMVVAILIFPFPPSTPLYVVLPLYILFRLSGALLFAIPIVLILICCTILPHRNTRVYAFSNGLIYSKSDQMIPLRWEGIQSLYHKSILGKGGTIHTYTIQLSNGQKILLPNELKKITHLGDMIEDKIARIWLPQVIGAYQNGDPIHFGPLTVNQSGLDSGKAHIPWAQIPRLVDARTCVVADQQGIFRRLLVREEDVPNAVLLQRLVNQIATANNSTRRSPHKGSSSHC
ncbi:hypothetical protein KSC_072110 [Ktedonobacter sp. SOSP1-52]|uniref:DUF6585 family protein n=1 Tax=Ktedonobacter sp. SOSP1-52 TaxID=2778366 RepID=UPI001915BE6A|nr:DUF6585 family protein [Ktedonobacter sp. SOSP1-52]GHO68319.1 hypothetical protein KSC_072110 [Ktedonobacter sp. SOSP1-52]